MSHPNQELIDSINDDINQQEENLRELMRIENTAPEWQLDDLAFEIRQQQDYIEELYKELADAMGLPNEPKFPF